MHSMTYDTTLQRLAASDVAHEISLKMEEFAFREIGGYCLLASTEYVGHHIIGIIYEPYHAMHC